MKTSMAFGAAIAWIGLLTSVPGLAAETRSWPWKDTAPVDPALALLSKIDALTVEAAEGSLRITVEAQAPTPGFTEVGLTPRIGDPTDLVFAFDVRGRRPQDMTAQVLTPVTIDVTYPDAPLASVGVVEVYAQENCKALSLRDKAEVECTMNPGSQQAP